MSRPFQTPDFQLAGYPEGRRLTQVGVGEYYFFMKVMERASESTVTAKGQITVPKAVRDRLKIRPGDRVKFFFDEHGHVVMLPKIPTAALYGSVRSRLGRTATLEEMEEAGAEGAVERFKRL